MGGAAHRTFGPTAASFLRPKSATLGAVADRPSKGASNQRSSGFAWSSCLRRHQRRRRRRRRGGPTLPWLDASRPPAQLADLLIGAMTLCRRGFGPRDTPLAMPSACSPPLERILQSMQQALQIYESPKNSAATPAVSIKPWVITLAHKLRPASKYADPSTRPENVDSTIPAGPL